MSHDFTVSSERLADDLGVVSVGGEVDIFTAPRLKQCLVELLDSGVRNVAVDLSEVTFIDSTALGVLIGGVRRVHSVDGTMTFVVVTRPVQRVLGVTGLDRIFSIHATRAEALKALA